MGEQASVAELLEERARLLAIGYRMLGSRADAEDAVQDTYARWYRMSGAERSAVRVPAAWLTTAMTRVCLNLLGSARHRREAYVGQWLPEPVAAGSELAVVAAAVPAADPADRAALTEEVTMALMVVLEALTPGERVAFVLHDVFGYPFEEVAAMVGRTPQACRKLASSARRHVAEERRRPAPADQRRQVVESFLAACRSGDVASLMSRLDPDAVATMDGGGHVRAALRPVVGADRVARFLIGALGKSEDLQLDVEHDVAESRLVLRRDGEVAAVASIDVADGRVARIWMVLNPTKLETWRPGAVGEGHDPARRPVEGA